MKIRLKDGNWIDWEANKKSSDTATNTISHKKEIKSVRDLIKQTVKSKIKKIISAKIDGKLYDLSSAVPEDAKEVIPIYEDDAEGLEILRHSTSHVMADAVLRLFTDAKLAIGPPIEDGFYYDFDVSEPFTQDDLIKIEEKMKQIIQEGSCFERMEVLKEEARKNLSQQNQNYKLEILDGIKDEKVSFYRHGKFTDLCEGPHIDNVNRIVAFKLLKATGAYWRGDEKNKMLQRIYGTAFFDTKSLDEHLKKLEEAKKRDHRKLGKDLDLFSIFEEAGSGLVYWHPNGAFVRHLIEEFWKSEHLKNGYKLIYSPHIVKGTLWQESGHTTYYKDYMYSPMEIDNVQYYAKPMNCPGHILIYKSAIRSYRDLPIRWAELGMVYRYERSGVLHGLLRVRGFTIDDAHIFCKLDELQSELVAVVKFAQRFLSAFGFKSYDVFLATKPKEKYIGTDEIWETSTIALKNALEESKLEYELDAGGGAFYGPKIDIKIKDFLGRPWQCSTIQLDFNLPERFDLNYIDTDGKEKRPIMIHRALLGSMERFFGALTENYAGAFPVWLSPVQVVILTVVDKHIEYAKKVRLTLIEKDLRVELDDSSQPLGAKIRKYQLLKVPFVIIIGEKEVSSNTISVRDRKKGDLGQMSVSSFIKKVTRMIKNKK